MINIRIKRYIVCQGNEFSILKRSEKASRKKLRNLHFILRTIGNTRILSREVLCLNLCSGKITLATMWKVREEQD